VDGLVLLAQLHLLPLLPAVAYRLLPLHIAFAAAAVAVSVVIVLLVHAAVWSFPVLHLTRLDTAIMLAPSVGGAVAYRFAYWLVVFAISSASSVA
jgi:hypothetical protein